MKKQIPIVAIIITLFSLNALSHGEDKPGPHGGYIRMPGAFHTEVVQEKEGYRVYLLDINWKNPSILDSSVKASIQSGTKTIDLACSKQSDSYFCKSSLVQNGQLNITAKREGQVGGVSAYNLPLKFEIPNAGHEGHH